MQYKNIPRINTATPLVADELLLVYKIMFYLWLTVWDASTEIKQDYKSIIYYYTNLWFLSKSLATSK